MNEFHVALREHLTALFEFLAQAAVDAIATSVVKLGDKALAWLREFTEGLKARLMLAPVGVAAEAG